MNPARLLVTALGAEPTAIGSAPGRVNLIGEHTDYTGGRCLPVALTERTVVAARPRTDAYVRVVSSAYPGETVTGTITAEPPTTTGGWADLAIGTVWALNRAGLDPTPGWDLAVDSAVPVGGGLSSSAALAIAVAAAVTEPQADPAGLIGAAVRAEHQVVGAPVGAMDQTVAVHGRAGHALALDFAAGSAAPIRPVPLPLGLLGAELLVIDTGERHRLADSGYGDRRADCAAAARLCGVGELSAAGPLPGALAAIAAGAADRADRDRLTARTRHVLTENDRVDRFIGLLGRAAHDRDPALAAELGALLTASHRSLADDFAVSTAVLDSTVDAALAAGAHGARLTGGGFGGSVIALVPTGRVEKVTAALARTAHPPARVLPVRSGDGMRRGH